MFTGGVTLLTASTGTQSVYIELNSAPNQTDYLTAPGGASLATLGPPAGSGVSTSTTEGGGSGALQFAFPTSILTAEPQVWAYSAAASLVAGGDVTIEATSASNVTATITNGGGGPLEVGQVTATVIQQPDTEAFVGVSESANMVGNATAGSESVSAADFTLTSSSNLTSYVSAESVGGGAIAAAIAHTSDQVNETTSAQVGSGADITVTGAVTVAADSQKNGFSYETDITNKTITLTPERAPGNSAYFFGEVETINRSGAPIFTFAPSVVSSVTIQNSSDLQLEVLPIDVTALGSQPERNTLLAAARS